MQGQSGHAIWNSCLGYDFDDNFWGEVRLHSEHQPGNNLVSSLLLAGFTTGNNDLTGEVRPGDCVSVFHVGNGSSSMPIDTTRGFCPAGSEELPRHLGELRSKILVPIFLVKFHSGVTYKEMRTHYFLRPEHKRCWRGPSPTLAIQRAGQDPKALPITQRKISMAIERAPRCFRF